MITTEAPPHPASAAAPRVTTSETASGDGDDELVYQRAPKLYLRLAFGIGFPFGSDVADVYEAGDENLDFSGFGTAMDWMGGVALLPQLILGLGATTDTLVSGTISGKGISDRELENSLYFAVLGAFADYYPFPPAGVHLQLLLGLSHLSRADDLGEHTGNGFGTVLGVGYDFPVGRRFNLGVLGRVAVSSFGMDKVNGRKPEPTLYEPTLLWTATFRPE